MNITFNMEMDDSVLAFAYLMRTRMILACSAEQRYKEFGLSIEQHAILLTLYNKTTPVYPKNIAKMLFRKPCTISNQLKNLLRKNLIILKVDADNRSRTEVWISETGQKIMKEISDLDLYREFFSNLSKQELNQLNNFLLRIFENNIGRLKQA